jgi:hypothetical protein
MQRSRHHKRDRPGRLRQGLQNVRAVVIGLKASAAAWRGSLPLLVSAD